jgi:hypothetical protein
MIIGPAEYGKYKVPCQILMERAGVDEMDVTQIELRPNGDVVITVLEKRLDGRIAVHGDEILTRDVMVP